MLTNFESYLYGILITDGNYYESSRNRGKFSIELNYNDIELLYKLKEHIPESIITDRIRNTNYKKEYHSAIWSIYSLPIREKILNWGFPKENKTINAAPPTIDYSEKYFWLGAFDGDGSIGFTSDNKPFVSFTTKSEILKNSLLNLLQTKFNIVKIISRNKRDNIYNFTVMNENAILLARYLYKDSEIYLQRKYNKFLELDNWIRPDSQPKRNCLTKRWTEEEINYILSHSIDESIKVLGRTKASINSKLYRIFK